MATILTAVIANLWTCWYFCWNYG